MEDRLILVHASALCDLTFEQTLLVENVFFSARRQQRKRRSLNLFLNYLSNYFLFQSKSIQYLFFSRCLNNSITLKIKSQWLKQQHLIYVDVFSGSRQDPPSTISIQSSTTDIPPTSNITTNPMISTSQHRALARIDRRSIDKVWKQMDRIVKYCQMPKMNLKNSPPYMLDILPDLYQTLREIINNYDDRLHILK